MSPENVEVEQAPAEVVQFDKLPEWKQKEKERKELKAKEREAKIMAKVQAQQQLIQEKRNQRREVLISRGIPAAQAEAMIQREEFFSLGLDKQIKVLVDNTQMIVTQILKDVDALKHNDEVLSDAMDLNFKAMARCLEKAGVKSEDQQVIITDVQKEMEAELKAKIETEAKALKQASEASEKAQIEAEAESLKTSPIIADKPNEAPPEFPAEAQVYGDEKSTS